MKKRDWILVTITLVLVLASNNEPVSIDKNIQSE